MPKKSYRVMHKFWLDITKDIEYWLDEQIHELKNQRLYTQVIRDGLQLILDLKAGRLEVLIELFPWVEEAFYQRFVGQQPVQDNSLQEQLARLESLLIQQGNTPVAIDHSGPKQLNVPQIAAPTYDETDDLIVVKKAKADGTSAKNFLDSAFGLIQ